MSLKFNTYKIYGNYKKYNYKNYLNHMNITRNKIMHVNKFDLHLNLT